MSKPAPVARAQDRPDETDLILRHVSRRHPLGLAQALVRSDEPLTDVDWSETQVTSRQRRLDRALRVKVGGEPRLLHVEWTTELPAAMHFRVFEYHCLSAISLEADARAQQDRVKSKQEPKQRPPPIESVVVVLDGPEAPLPDRGEYRTSPTEQEFSGVQYRIVPVYQRTVAELEAMGGVFWLVFVPLAKDVDEEKLVRVIERVRRGTSTDDFHELMAGMAVLARSRKRDPNVEDMLRSLVPKGIVMENWIYKEGEAAGIEKGFAKGIEEGIEKGIEKGILQMTSFATSLIERRIGRSLRPKERNRIGIRLQRHGSKELSSMLLEASPAALIAWLAPRKSRAAQQLVE